MGVVKRTYYSATCDCCNSRLEDWTGELAGITNTKKEAIECAKENGWIRTEDGSFYCPDCEPME